MVLCTVLTHNLTPTWLTIGVYMCIDVLEFLGVGKGFFSPKSFQRALLPCAPQWSMFQSGSSFGWRMSSCTGLLSGSLIFWSPCSWTDLGEAKACLGPEGSRRTVLLFISVWCFSHRRMPHPCLRLALPNDVGRRQSMCISSDAEVFPARAWVPVLAFALHSKAKVGAERGSQGLFPGVLLTDTIILLF